MCVSFFLMVLEQRYVCTIYSKKLHSLKGVTFSERPEIFIESVPNKTYTLRCLCRAGSLGSTKTTLKFKYEI